MRTAVVITGLVKRIKEDAPSVLVNLIEPYDADVFLSVWKPEVPCLDELIKTYNPKLLEIEDPNSPHMQQELATLPDKARGYGGGIVTECRMERCWQMFYRIWRGNELRKTYERINGFTYDCVIRFRFEIGIHQPCPVITPQPNTVYIPDDQNHHGGVCDTMAIGDSAAMDHYSSIYSHLRDYSNRNLPTHQESVVRKHLELNNVAIERFRLHTTLRNGQWNPPY